MSSATALPAPFRCGDCSGNFPSKSGLLRHAEESGHLTSRYCKPCRRLFDSSKALRQHERTSPKHHVPRARTGRAETMETGSSVAAPRQKQPWPPLDGSDSIRSNQSGQTDTSQRKIVREPKQPSTKTRKSTDGIETSVVSLPIRPKQRNNGQSRIPPTSNKTGSNSPYLAAPGTTVTEIRGQPGLAKAKSNIDTTARKYQNAINNSNPVAGSTSLAADIALGRNSEGTAGRRPNVAVQAKRTKAVMGGQKLTENAPAECDQINSSEQGLQPKPVPPRGPPLSYPSVPVSPENHRMHGKNQYSTYGPSEETLLLEALELRCHSTERLVEGRFFIPENPDIRIPKGMVLSDFQYSPPPDPSKFKCRAVAIDCEMVGVENSSGPSPGETGELAQLCAVDVLTGQVLINKFVQPEQRVVNWRTRYSGITPGTMYAAKREGRLLHGWQAAREELFRHIDSDTILVGHGILNDLQILRLAHTKIVDTSFQTSEAVFGHREKLYRHWGLKDLAGTLLGMKIQVGKKGHDCVEDTLATRELTLWCIRFPKELQVWADMTWGMFERGWIIKQLQQVESRKKQAAEARARKTALARALIDEYSTPYDPCDFGAAEEELENAMTYEEAVAHLEDIEWQ